MADRAAGKKLRRAIGGVALAVALPIALGLLHTIIASWGKILRLDEVPARRVGIVFGARVYPSHPSVSVARRLDLAVDLVKAGKLDKVIVSGDGRAKAFNEPAVMRKYLVDHSVPPEMIVEDPGGYDTYDTCKRAYDSYGVREAVLLTQDYHVRRAVTICEGVGISAVGVGDETLRSGWAGYWLKAALREPFAVLKMELDLISGRPPICQD